LLLVSTHLVTQVYAPPEGAIGKDSAQGEALPAAELFVPVELAADTGLDNCYKGQAGGQTVGYAAQATVNGYGGPIELDVGMDINGALTGISVGGAQFNETPGLGEKAKEPEFKNQFVGIQTPVGLGGGAASGDATSSASQSWVATPAPAGDTTSSATRTATPAPAGGEESDEDDEAPAAAAAPAPEAASNIDAISGATITSKAVVNGVNLCAEFIKSLLAGGNA
jgi:electron transport complex protein RnfG